MRRLRILLLTAGLLAPLGGCVSSRPAPGEFAPPPPLPGPQAIENPLFLPQGPDGYPLVFNQAFSAVNAFFPIARSNIYAGTIESEVVITAGFWDAPRYDFYSFNELWESVLQSIRRRVLVAITPAESGGYFVDLQVLKELEDLPKPIHANAGAAAAFYESPFERTLDPLTGRRRPARGWIPLGRDREMEQLILNRLKCGR